jgi:phosphoribosyl 1,2-cyclic phosphate phosphodiesterase
MKITFLGTAAATSYPLAFCQCDHCKEARKLGGKNLRKRSSVIINDDLLIDLGPDVLSASFMYNKSIADIRYCLQTHPHSDHFDPSHLTTRIPEYMGVDTPPLEIYASLATLKKMSEMVKNEGYVEYMFDPNEQKRMNLKISPVFPQQTFLAGNYEITAFSSDHDKSTDSLIYSISECDFTLLYATDTDLLRQDVITSFVDKKMRFNVVVMDHTYGPDAGSGDHLNANRFIDQIKLLRKHGLLANNARIFATHISHEGNPPHTELSNYAKQFGYEIAYDGMVVE